MSVLNQNYPNLEYIIIDGGSTDNSVEIIKKYEDCLAFWVSEPDRGQAHAINKGLQKATGEIFNWINSDDFLEPGALNAIGKAFVKAKSAKIVCGYTYCFFDETKEHSHTYRMGLKKTIAETVLNVEMNQPGSFYKTEVVRDFVGVNESLRYVFDDELWFRFLLKYGMERVQLIDDRLANFRLHGASKTIGEGLHAFYKELLNLHLFILRQTGMPQPIVQYLEKEQEGWWYQSPPWDILFSDHSHFLAHYTARYRHVLYKDKHYALARKGLWSSIMRGEITSNLALAGKLMLPAGVINAMRNLKHTF